MAGKFVAMRPPEGGDLVDVPEEQVGKAVAAKYTVERAPDAAPVEQAAPQFKTFVSPDGEEVDVPADQADKAVASGYKPAGGAPAPAPVADEPGWGIGQQAWDFAKGVNRAGMALAEGVLGGVVRTPLAAAEAAPNYLADLVTPGKTADFGRSMDEANAGIDARAAEFAPTALVGRAAGDAALNLVTGGLAAAGTKAAAKAVAPKLLTQATAALAKAGKWANRALVGAGILGEGYLEGGAQGAAQEVDRSIVTGNYKNLAQKVVASGNESGLIGAGFNAAGHLVISTAGKVIRGLSPSAPKAVPDDLHIQVGNSAKPDAATADIYDAAKPLRAKDLVDTSAPEVQALRRNTTPELAKEVEVDALLAAEPKLNEALSLRNELEEYARKAAKKRYLAEFGDEQAIPEDFLGTLRAQADREAADVAIGAYGKDVAALEASTAELRAQHQEALGTWESDVGQLKADHEKAVSKWEKDADTVRTQHDKSIAQWRDDISKAEKSHTAEVDAWHERKRAYEADQDAIHREALLPGNYKKTKPAPEPGPKPVIGEMPPKPTMGGLPPKPTMGGLPPKPVFDEQSLRAGAGFIPSPSERMGAKPLQDVGAKYFDDLMDKVGLNDGVLETAAKNNRGEGGALIDRILEKKTQIRNGLRGKTLTQGQFFDALDDMKAAVQKATDKSKGGLEEFLNPRAEDFRLLLEGQHPGITAPLNPRLMAEQAELNKGWSSNIRASKQGLLGGMYVDGRVAGADPFDVKKVVAPGKLAALFGANDPTGALEDAFKSDLRLSAQSLTQRLETWRVANPSKAFPGIADNESGAKLARYKQLIGEVEDEINRSSLAKRYAAQNAPSASTVMGSIGKLVNSTVRSVPLAGGLADLGAIRKAYKIDRAAEEAGAAFKLRASATKVQERINKAANVNHFTRKLERGAQPVRRALQIEAVRRYVEHSQKLEDPTTDEHQQLQSQMQHIEQDAGPDAAKALTEQTAAVHDFVLSKVPTIPATAFSVEKRDLSPPVMEQAAPYVDAATDPASAIERLSEGTYTPEDRETLEALYPDMLREFEEKVSSQLHTMKDADIDTQMRISMALGKPLAGPLADGSIAFWQDLSTPTPGVQGDVSKGTQMASPGSLPTLG